MTLYCTCETPQMDIEHDAGCRRCGLPVDFSPKGVAMKLNTEPCFSTASQQVLAAGERVYAAAPTVCVKEGAEGTLAGWVGADELSPSGLVVDWDTPSGEPYRETVSHDKIRALYR